MEGGMRNKSGELPAEAGVIPRAVRQFFDTVLEAQNADYSMEVTFLELIIYEEITDLLAPEECSRSFEGQKKPISLMEDGKGCVVLRGLEEALYSANEIYNLLEGGAAKRRTADTLLNKHSSRSHSVFTITVHIKEATVGDEELIKCGKLNLVDLLGSENISRSGAREKKLASLQPISPSAQCLEETLSTLDYAHCTKYKKNKPEANQKISRAALLKDLYLEIERMKQGSAVHLYS